MEITFSANVNIDMTVDADERVVAEMRNRMKYKFTEFIDDAIRTVEDPKDLRVNVNYLSVRESE